MTTTTDDSIYPWIECAGTKYRSFVYIIFLYIIFISLNLLVHTGRCLRPMVCAWLRKHEHTRNSYSGRWILLFLLINTDFYWKRNSSFLFFSSLKTAFVLLGFLFVLLCSPPLCFYFIESHNGSAQRSMSWVAVLYLTCDSCSGACFHMDEHMHH